MDAEPPFRSIAIAGLGLIGGSLALATRERWPSVRVTGVDTESVLAHARGSGAIDRAASTLADAGEVELIVLAAPVRQNIDLLGTVSPDARAIVTDVGSTKRAIVEAARAQFAAGASGTFVGGHPLGGAERGGFAFARPDLFDGRPWIFTPDGADTAAVDKLTRFVMGLGAVPMSMTADEHDLAMAFVSHLPQLVATALMDVVGTASGARGLGVAGRGLVDTTRLAASPANVWRDVCATNADAIGPALDALIARLGDLRAGLMDAATVEQLFDSSCRWRGVLMKGRE